MLARQAEQVLGQLEQTPQSTPDPLGMIEVRVKLTNEMHAALTRNGATAAQQLFRMAASWRWFDLFRGGQG